MNELRDLYQEVILDHGKSPRNFRELESFSNKANGHNPLCGDTITIFIDVSSNRIKDISFKGRGCAISVASASMMTELLINKTIEDSEILFQHFHSLVTSESDGTNYQKLQDYDKLNVLSGVREFPMRVKCATLPWHTYKAALANELIEASTE